MNARRGKLLAGAWCGKTMKLRLSALPVIAAAMLSVLAWGGLAAQTLPPAAVTATSPAPFFYTHEREVKSRYFAQGLGFYNAKSYELAARYFLAALQSAAAADDVTLSSNTIRYFLGLTYWKAGMRSAAQQQWDNILTLATATSAPLQVTALNDIRAKQQLLAALATTSSVVLPPHVSAGVHGALAELVEQFYRTPVETPLQYVLSTAQVAAQRAQPQNWFDVKPLETVTPITLLNHPSGGIELVDLSMRQLFVLDAQGHLLEKLSPLHVPFFYYPLKRPYALARAADGTRWLTDLAHDQLVALTPQGKLLLRVGGSGIAAGQFLGPKGVTIGPNGNIWVADSGNARLQVFTPQGQLIRTVGRRGHGAGEFLYPSRIVYAKTLRQFYVLDPYQQTLQSLDERGKPIARLQHVMLQGAKDFKLVPGHEQLAILLGTADVAMIELQQQRIKPLRLQSKPQTLSQWELTRTAAARTYAPRQLAVQDEQYVALTLAVNGDLYLASGRTGNIAKFVPHAQMGANAQVFVEHVDSTHFPAMRVEVSVRDSYSTALGGLVTTNFTLLEEGRKQVVTVAPVAVRQAALPRRFVALIEQAAPFSKRPRRVPLFVDEWLTALNADDLLMTMVYGTQANQKTTAETGSGTGAQRRGVQQLARGQFLTQQFKRLLHQHIYTTLSAANTATLNAAGAVQYPQRKTPRQAAGADIPAASQRGFVQALQLGMEALLPYAAAQAIVIFAATPHPLAAWQDTAASQPSGYDALLAFAQANHIPIFIIYGGDEARAAPALNPLRLFAARSGGNLFVDDNVTPAQLLSQLAEYAAGRYELHYTSHQRPLGQGLFYPVTVRVQLDSTGGQDSWNGFIHP